MPFTNIETELRAALIRESLAEQAVAAEFENGETATFVNMAVSSGDHSKENEFVENISGKNHITRIACMWKDGTLDMISAHLRHLIQDKGLVDQNTMIILAGEGSERKERRLIG